MHRDETVGTLIMAYDLDLRLVTDPDLHLIPFGRIDVDVNNGRKLLGVVMPRKADYFTVSHCLGSLIRAP